MAEPITLKEQAGTMLQSLIASATQAGDFVKEQMPLVIRELLAYSMAVNVAGLIVGVAAICALVWWVFFCLRKHEKDRERGGYYSSDWTFCALLSGLIGGGVVIFFTVTCLLEVLQLSLAPRVWLIEYAAHLVKR